MSEEPDTTSKRKPKRPPKLKPEATLDALGIAMSRLPGQIKFRGLNALHGVAQAKLLLEVDREIASFRAITAEEEAASALFMALKLRNYPGSDKLNLGNHRHKAAVPPFMQAVGQSLASSAFNKATFDFNWRKPSLTLHLPLAQLGVQLPGMENARATLEEPLHLYRGTDTDEPYLFANELHELAKASTQSTIEKVIAAQANARNTLLYASDGACPKSQATADVLAQRAKSVELMLFVAIAVMQTKTHQFMAMQGLQAFLGIVAPNEQVSFDYGLRVEPDVVFKMRSDETAEVTFAPRAGAPRRSEGQG